MKSAYQINSFSFYATAEISTTTTTSIGDWNIASIIQEIHTQPTD